MPIPIHIQVIAAAIKILAAVGFIMLTVPMLVWMERKLIADFQARVGPQRVGPFGLLQSFADGIKLVAKEGLIPRSVDTLLYLAAPAIVMLPALGVAAVVPFGAPLDLFGYRFKMVIADLPVGLLYILALTSLSVYGIVLAGWASNNKYSLLGGLRSAAQMVSYELPMGMSVVAGFMIASAFTKDNLVSLSLQQVVESQKGNIFHWAALNPQFLLVPGLLAMTTFFIGGIAETNRAPFDLPEAESELIGGYHTEYGGLRWAMFFLGEYAAMLNVASLTTVLFLGGYHPPYESPFPVGSVINCVEGISWFGIKVFGIQAVYMWLRSTMPRIRYDQLMAFTWKMMLPTTLVNLLVIGLIITVAYPSTPPPVLVPVTKAETKGNVRPRPIGEPGEREPGEPGEMPLGRPGPGVMEEEDHEGHGHGPAEGGAGLPKAPATPPHQQFGGLVEPDGSSPKAPAPKALTPNSPSSGETKGH